MYSGQWPAPDSSWRREACYCASTDFILESSLVQRATLRLGYSNAITSFDWFCASAPATSLSINLRAL